jgi:hypothetical protein
MSPPDLSLRSAAAAVGAGMSVLPLVAGQTALDLAFVLVGVVAAAGAVLPDRVAGRGRAARLRSALPTVCLLTAVGHLAVRPVSPATSVAEAVLVAGYLALACEAEIARDTPRVQLRWAAAPIALAVAGAVAASAAAVLADRAASPLAVVATGLVAVALLFVELQRRTGQRQRTATAAWRHAQRGGTPAGGSGSHPGSPAGGAPAR